MRPVVWVAMLAVVALSLACTSATAQSLRVWPGFRTYTHPDSQWTISYPRSWQLDDSSLTGSSSGNYRILFSSSDSARYAATVAVSRRNGRQYFNDPEIWSNSRLKQIQESLCASFGLSSWQKSQVSQHTAYEAIYSCMSQDRRVVFIELDVIVGDDAFIVAGAATEERWDSVSTLLRQLVYSFKPAS